MRTVATLTASGSGPLGWVLIGAGVLLVILLAYVWRRSTARRRPRPRTRGGVDMQERVEAAYERGRNRSRGGSGAGSALPGQVGGTPPPAPTPPAPPAPAPPGQPFPAFELPASPQPQGEERQRYEAELGRMLAELDEGTARRAESPDAPEADPHDADLDEMRALLRTVRESPGPNGSSDKPAAGERLAFTAAYPGEMPAQAWQPLLVVLHTPGARAAVEALLRRRSEDWTSAPSRTETAATVAVARGTTLRLVPTVAGVEFNPPRLEVAWFEDVQEASFRMRATGEPGTACYGAVEVFVGALLVAVIPVGMRLTDTAGTSAGPLATTQASVLDRIFVSYSRRDSPVVDACTEVYKGLGVQVLMDTVDLRGGQDWRQSLHSLIDQADLFQLYWSSASAASTEVEHEWRYAQTVAGKGTAFIRPLYWETPMPPPPPELSSIHFTRVEIGQLGRAGWQSL